MNIFKQLIAYSMTDSILLPQIENWKCIAYVNTEAKCRHILKLQIRAKSMLVLITATCK